MSMKIFKKILMLLAVLMMVVTPFAAITADTTSSSSSADTAKTTDDSLKKVKEKGTLVVGLSADYPPYEFTTKQHNHQWCQKLNFDAWLKSHA